MFKDLQANKKFKNIHVNKLAFVVCNGTSLNDVDVTKLHGIIFAMNRGYLKDKLSITYLTTVDPIIENQFRNEILSVECEAKWSSGLPTHRWRWSPNVPKFTGDITKPIWQGHSVTNPTLQLAYFMGCNPVYIIGMDHYLNYKNCKKINGKWQNQGKDSNHFDPNYFEKDKLFYGQDLKAVEVGYRSAYEAFNKAGRILRNASTKTALSENIIPRMDIKEILG